MTKNTQHHIYSIVVIIMFLGVIFTPFIGWIIFKDKTISTVEKRTLSKLPNFPKTKNSLTKYPKLFDTYFSDHFGFRDEIIDKYYLLKTKFDKNAISQDVTFGKDGWMFLGGIKKNYSRYENPMGDAMNIDLYQPTQLTEFANYINKVSSYLNDKNITYIFIIAPNKHTIYFDKLPPYIKKQNNVSSTDQLVTYLNKHTNVKIIDLRKALLKHKNEQQLYYKTDTHWNYLGANFAQYEISKILAKIFPNKIKPYLYKKDEFKLYKKPGGDLAIFSKQKNIIENDYRPIFKQSKMIKYPSTVGIRQTFTSYNKNGQLNALIFRDSFFTALVPYMERRFRYSTYIWEKLSFKKLKKYITKRKPNIVIEEWVERSFPYVPHIKIEK